MSFFKLGLIFSKPIKFNVKFFVKRIAPLMIIPLALNKTILGIGITLVLLVTNIITTAVIVNNHPGTELGIFG